MSVRWASAALLCALAAVAGCGPCADEQAAAPEQTPTASAPTPTPTVPAPPGPRLAIGLTEPNPNFLWPAGARDVAPEFARWRDELERLQPTYYRLVLDWASLQPEPGPPNFAIAHSGCLRDKPPCAPWNGLREQLEALAARQREGGWEALVVLAGTPAWAARRAGGCERDNVEPRSRPPRDGDGMAAYGEFVTAVLDEARAAGATLRFWSPWNEPNHPFFISPQRNRCDRDAKSRAVAPYVALARTLQLALDSAPGEQELALGELAGLDERKPMTTSIREFIAGIPADLACGTRIWTQHGYVGGTNPVNDLERALERKGCERLPEIWITETGVGAPRRGERRRTSLASQVRACGRLHRRLERWYEDERVTAAFQYTFREDDRFPTGLVTTDLSRAYPALGEWRAWGGGERPQPTDPPPPDSCG
jgi:hypothetical protein